MKKIIYFFIVLSIAIATPCYAKEQTDNVKADSWLYFLDTVFDSTMYKIGLRSADSIATERLDELNEAIILEDVEAAEKAKEELDEIMPNVENRTILQDVFETEEKIQQNYDIDLIELTIKLNNYPNLAELTKGYKGVGISLIGLKTGYYAVYLEEGRVLSIQEKQYLIVPNIEIDYTNALKASQDQNYMNNQLDELLKYKRIYEDAQSLMAKEGLSE